MVPRVVFDSEVEDAEAPWSRDLCFEDGDRIIALEDNPYEHLVLNSEVLGRASGFFECGAHSAWTGLAKKIAHPDTKQSVEVLTYYLVRDPKDYTLILSQTVSALYLQ